jgi:hypothetical protein
MNVSFYQAGSAVPGSLLVQALCAETAEINNLAVGDKHGFAI